MLEIKSVSKSFPGVQALSDVSFTVQRATVHALVGENGAGKSTLMKILSGVYSDYDGEIVLEGQRLALRSPRDAQRHGIAIIHQELNLIPELTVVDNVFLGIERRTRLGDLDSRAMERECRLLLQRFNLDIPPNRPVKWLRVGEKQLVEVAKALALQAQLFILDEPTSALSEGEIERLFAVIASLKATGVTMIYISHKLDEIFRIADTVTVLRDGQHIGTCPIEETNQGDMIRMMVGRTLTELFPKEAVPAGEEVLRVEQLNLAPDRQRNTRSLCDISFTVKRGEILGLAGLMGAGRTELLETLFGVYPPSRVTGRILLNGREQHNHSPEDAIAAGFAFVTEDRKLQSLITGMSVAHNLTLAALKRFLTLGFIRLRAESVAVDRSIDELHIRTPSRLAIVNNLSGGNQQKVVLAKGLLNTPAVLLLDEPTRGIDVGAKAEIYGLISHLAQNGAAILMASSELPEILAMCDRVLVFCEGRLTGEFTRAEATQERIMQAATARELTNGSNAVADHSDFGMPVTSRENG
jgi:ribose transport system ATP-binding protein